MNLPTDPALRLAAEELTTLRCPPPRDDDQRPIFAAYSDGTLEFSGPSDQGIDILCKALRALALKSEPLPPEPLTKLDQRGPT